MLTAVKRLSSTMRCIEPGHRALVAFHASRGPGPWAGSFVAAFARWPGEGHFEVAGWEFFTTICA